jgi:hypothetical protein
MGLKEAAAAARGLDLHGRLPVVSPQRCGIRCHPVAECASDACGRDDFDSLSPWERQVLSGIEHDLATSDPRLAEQMQSAASRRRPGWWPMSARCTVLLVPVLLVLVLAAAVVPAPWWPVLRPVTTLVVVPWLLLCVKDNSRDH